MLELLERIVAINSYAKDCHYNFQDYGQHLLADVNQDKLLDYKDLINEVCFLGLGEEAPKSEEVLAGATEFIPQVDEDDQVNFARLKLLVKETLVHIEEMELPTRGFENLIGGIAQDLQQLHGLLFKQVDDEADIEYLQNAEDKKKDEDVDWITVKGNHIPVQKGETKEEAVEEFLKSKNIFSKENVLSKKAASVGEVIPINIGSLGYNGEFEKNKTMFVPAFIVDKVGKKTYKAKLADGTTQEVNSRIARMDLENDFKNFLADDFDSQLKKLEDVSKDYKIEKSPDTTPEDAKKKAESAERKKAEQKRWEDFLREKKEQNDAEQKEYSDVFGKNNQKLDDLDNKQYFSEADVRDNYRDILKEMKEFSQEEYEAFDHEEFYKKRIEFIDDRIDTISKFAKNNNFEVSTDSSNISDSVYLTLSKDYIDKDGDEDTIYYKIRLSDHPDYHGGNDLDTRFLDSIKDVLIGIKKDMEEKGIAFDLKETKENDTTKSYEDTIDKPELVK